MTLGLNHHNTTLENVNELNTLIPEENNSLQPLLNSLRIKILNENVDRAKESLRTILETENLASFVTKINVAINKHYDPALGKVVFPPEIVQMIQETRDNPELSAMSGILDELGLFTNKSTYTKEEKIALIENCSQVSQRINKKIQYHTDRAQEIKQLADDLIQLLRSCLKKEDDSKSSHSRRVGTR